MANYTGADTIISFDAPDTSLKDISAYVTDISGISIEAVLEETHTFGDSWVESMAAGLRKVGDITISGFYNDAGVDGPDFLFVTPGNTVTKTLKVLFGAAKYFQAETIIKSYTRTPIKGGLTKYSVVLTVTGTPSEN